MDSACVEVPLSAAPNGTLVYIRLRATTTDSMAYDLGGGFVFVEDSVISYPRRAVPGHDANGNRAPVPDLSLRMIPNPLRRGVGELRVRVEREGAVELWLSDVAGIRLRDLPRLNVDRIGEFVLPVDFVDLPSGAYVLRAQQGEVGRSVVVVR